MSLQADPRRSSEVIIDYDEFLLAKQSSPTPISVGFTSVHGPGRKSAASALSSAASDYDDVILIEEGDFYPPEGKCPRLINSW